MLYIFFFFNDTATTEIYTLSLHDALPIRTCRRGHVRGPARGVRAAPCRRSAQGGAACACGSEAAVRRRPRDASEPRSEEHTSELQSLAYLVCRLLLEKKKNTH